MSSVIEPWQPNRITRMIRAYPTGSCVVHVETDCGEGFLKALSNKAEPHNLASEVVGTLLARWLKLPTLDFALIQIGETVPVLLDDNTRPHPGPGFITRAESGHPWGGAAGELDLLDNLQDVARLVVFDTWTRNCDRYGPKDGQPPRINRDNVFFSEREATPGRFVLRAIDQGCCFTCAKELTVRLDQLDQVEDPKLYGCFPEFRPRITRQGALAAIAEVEVITQEEVGAMIQQVPRNWEVAQGTRDAWCRFICKRAKFVRRIVEREWPAQSLFDDVAEQEGQS